MRLPKETKSTTKHPGIFEIYKMLQKLLHAFEFYLRLCLAAGIFNNHNFRTPKLYRVQSFQLTLIQAKHARTIHTVTGKPFKQRKPSIYLNKCD